MSAPENEDERSVQPLQVLFSKQPCRPVFLNTSCDADLSAGMITIPAASLAGAQIVQAGGANTNTTNSSQGTVTVTLPVSGNMVNAGGMVMVRPCAEVPNILLLFFLT